MADPRDELVDPILSNEPGFMPPREPLRIRVSPYDTPPPVVDPGKGAFNPEGTDYDYAGAAAAGITPDATGHWATRDPNTGLILKGTGHETFGKTIAGEDAAGYEIIKRGDRYYSSPKGGWGAPDQETGRPAARLFEPDQAPAPPAPIPRPSMVDALRTQNPAVDTRPGLPSLGESFGKLGSLVSGAGAYLNQPLQQAPPRAPVDPTAGPRQMWQGGYPSPQQPTLLQRGVTEGLNIPWRAVETSKGQFDVQADPAEVDARRQAQVGAVTDVTSNLAGAGVAGASIRGGASAGLFGGRLAKGFDPNREKLAELMHQNGVPAPQIWKETGMVKFADGKWAHEISDLGAYYKGDVESITKSIFDQKYPDRVGQYDANPLRMNISRNDALLKLQGKQQLYLPDVLHHPELFAKYPELRKMPVSEDAFMNARGGYLPHSVAGTDVRPAEIKYREEYQPGKMARGATFDTLLHEIQHAIQQIEGFAKGASPDYFAPGSKAAKIYDDMMSQMPPGLSQQRRDQFERYARVHAGNEGYTKSPGENLANLAIERKDLTPEQASAINPPSQFRVPLEQQKDFVEYNRLVNPQGTTPQQMGGILRPTMHEGPQLSAGPSGLMPPKSERRAQGSLNPLDEADVTWKGKPMAEWKPQDWKEVGDHYGVKNLGPLSPVEKYVSPDGYHFEIPGGTKGTWTYYDLLHMKANPINPNNLPHELHAELQRKLGRTMTPHGEVGQDQIWNGFMFGMTSASNPLFPNQLSASRLRLRDPKMLDALADSIPWKAGEEVSKELRGAKDLEIGRMFNLHEGKSAGSTGLGTRGGVNYTYIAELAQMFRKNPEWFRKKADEPWIDFVERLATQTKGLSMKTGSFSSVWQDPYHAAISAIDRHMAKEFERRGGLFLNPADQDKWQAKTLAKWNKELPEGEKVGSWKELTTKSGFEGFMSEELLNYVGAHSKKDFRNTVGEINPSLPKHVREARKFYEPEKGLEAGAAYKRALAVNQKAANEQGLNLFMSQWFEWDRIRQRFEPHENMFPGLSRMPAPSARQLQTPFAAHAETGHTAYDYGPTGRMNPTKRFPRNPSEMGYLGVPLAAGGAAGIGSLVKPSYQEDVR